MVWTHPENRRRNIKNNAKLKLRGRQSRASRYHPLHRGKYWWKGSIFLRDIFSGKQTDTLSCRAMGIERGWYNVIAGKIVIILICPPLIKRKTRGKTDGSNHEECGCIREERN